MYEALFVEKHEDDNVKLSDYIQGTGSSQKQTYKQQQQQPQQQ